MDSFVLGNAPIYLKSGILARAFSDWVSASMSSCQSISVRVHPRQSQSPRTIDQRFSSYQKNRALDEIRNKDCLETFKSTGLMYVPLGDAGPKNQKMAARHRLLLLDDDP